MPRIGALFGITFYMYWSEDQRHHIAHVHAYYAGESAVLALEDGRVLEGELPKRSAKRARAWVLANRAALQSNWERAMNHERLEWID